jgi:hypothetical protein
MAIDWGVTHWGVEELSLLAPVASAMVAGGLIGIEMTEALVDGISGLRADDREIRRGGPTFTVDTLEEIHYIPGSQYDFLQQANNLLVVSHTDYVLQLLVQFP